MSSWSGISDTQTQVITCQFAIIESRAACYTAYKMCGTGMSGFSRAWPSVLRASFPPELVSFKETEEREERKRSEVLRKGGRERKRRGNRDSVNKQGRKGGTDHRTNHTTSHSLPLHDAYQSIFNDQCSSATVEMVAGIAVSRSSLFCLDPSPVSCHGHGKNLRRYSWLGVVFETIIVNLKPWTNLHRNKEVSEQEIPKHGRESKPGI